MRILFFLLLCALPAYSFAQDTLPALDSIKQLNALQPKGYTGGAQLGLFVSVSDNGIFPSGFTFQTAHGYRFNPHLAVYGMAELNFYEDVYLLPLLASVKTTLYEHKITPYLVGELGYALELMNDKRESLSNKTSGGLAFGGEFGLQFPTPQKTAFTFSAGFRTQRMRREYWSRDEFYERRTIARRLHIRVGMTF